jgi:hypothetical protein
MPPPVWQPTGDRITWRSISFIVPPGMTGSAKADFYEMGGLGIRGGLGQCVILIFRELPSAGDLATQAHRILIEALSAIKVGVADSHGGPNLVADRRVGHSADGWRYVELSGMLTQGVGGRARIMLIDRGAMVVPIVAISTPGNGCVGLSIETTPNSNTITWMALYYSLKLGGAMPSDHLRQQIVGGWEGSAMSRTAAAGMLQDEVYEPNGRYGASFGAIANGQQSSSSDSGRYVVAADKLATFPDAGTPETHLIRIVEDYSLMTPSKSTVQLCKMKVDPGGSYERCVSRR